MYRSNRVFVQQLQVGAQGFQVRYLQRLLNKAGANPPLREDGVFGPRTNDAVVRFRSSQGAVLPTGRATPPLWNDLGVRVEIEHPIIGMGQPTNMSCWSVAMTMMLGTMMSVGAGAATLGATGGLQTTPENVATFARQHGLRIVSQMQSIAVSQLIALLHRGPLLAIGAGGIGTNRWAHASVISGIYSDLQPDASGTMIRIHDPWPPGSPGRVYGVFYSGGSQDVPCVSYNLFGAYLVGR